MCVIKQLHSTQRVSMTTKKLIGNSQRECLCTQTHSIGRWVPEASTSCHAMSCMSVEGCPPNRVCRQKRFAHKIALTARRREISKTRNSKTRFFKNLRIQLICDIAIHRKSILQFRFKSKLIRKHKNCRKPLKL